jgi:hypothetical protein
MLDLQSHQVITIPIPDEDTIWVLHSPTPMESGADLSEHEAIRNYFSAAISESFTILSFRLQRQAEVEIP